VQTWHHHITTSARQGGSTIPGGYLGKLLWVDLTRGRISDEPLDERLARKFIGGYGMGVRTLFSRQPAGVDPLGPDNTLGFLTGPLTGTWAISGTRFTVVAKSPLTGTWGDANSGGHFAAYLKFAGYDGVFFTGASETPVSLFVDDGKAELRAAADLWGKDTYETDDRLKLELGRDVAIACIGPAGEKRSLISSIVHNKGSVAARSGLGAVMGAKRLKAIAVRGKRRVPTANPERVQALRQKYLPDLSGEVALMKRYGTTFVTVPSAQSGDSPIKNWGGDPADFPDPLPIGGDALLPRQLKNTGCYRCPIGCEAIMKEGTGEYHYDAGSFRPEYETVAMLGTDCLNNNPESILKMNDVCNRYGIDTISTGAVLAFATECYENGLIGKADTDGVEMTWGNHRSLVAMTEKIARREGFGDVLADGVRVAAARIGHGAERYAIHIHGQEVPAHSPLASINMAITYLANATPARHTQGSEEHHPEGLLPEFNRRSQEGRAAVHASGSNFQHSLAACGMCLFVYMHLPHVEVMTEFMQAVTGWDITTEELLTIGERIANLRQAFNIREGLNPVQFNIPGRVYGQPPHQVGPLAGVTVDAERLVRQYLKEMDWDLETARPSKAKLLALGLDDVARELWPGQ